MSRTQNGRVAILHKTQPPDIAQLFAMYDKIPSNQCVSLREPTIGQWEDTPLSRAYFSEANMRILQNGIRAGVYRKSNQQYVVGMQDNDALNTIMRSVFLQHAANQPTHIAEQIQQLNQLVLDYCIFHVYSEAQSYVKYLKDVSTLPVPIAMPIVESQRDKNNYTMPAWF
jgi:hypothetical protein